MLCLSWSVSQVDFPTSSFEVLFSTPPPAEFCPQYDFSRLDTISQIQLQDVLHKKAFFWSETPAHTLTNLRFYSSRVLRCLETVLHPCRCERRVSHVVQVDVGGQAPPLGETGLLSGRERSPASSSSQRPLLGVGLPA